MTAPGGVSLRLDGARRFIASTPSGHEVSVDASLSGGGENSAARPTELVLVALGGCMGMDVISILHKMRQDVTSYEISVTGTHARQHPQVYTSIAMTHRVHGRRLPPSKVARAIQLSMTRYCPVHAMLRDPVSITAAYEVVDDQTGERATGTVEIDAETLVR